MCGIFGSIGKINIKRFSDSLKLIKHRGPDSSKHSIVYNDLVYLLFHRLKIVDLSSDAMQPFQNGKYTSSFNYSIIFDNTNIIIFKS